MNGGVFIIGFVVLVLGLLAMGYTLVSGQPYFFSPPDSGASRPYAYLAIPMMIAGVILMIISAMVPSVRTTTESSYVEPVSTPVRKRRVVEEEV